MTFEYSRSNTLDLTTLPKEGLLFYWAPSLSSSFKFRFSRETVASRWAVGYILRQQNKHVDGITWTIPNDKWETTPLKKYANTNYSDRTAKGLVADFEYLKRTYNGDRIEEDSLISLDGKNKLTLLPSSRSEDKLTIPGALNEGTVLSIETLLKTVMDKKIYLLWALDQNKSFILDLRAFNTSSPGDYVNITLSTNNTYCTNLFEGIDLTEAEKTNEELFISRVSFWLTNPEYNYKSFQKLRKQINQIFKSTGINLICDLIRDTSDKQDHKLVFREYIRIKKIKPEDYPEIVNFEQFALLLREGSIQGIGATAEELRLFGLLQKTYREEGSLSISRWHRAYNLYTDLCTRINFPSLTLTLPTEDQIFRKRNTEEVIYPTHSPLDEMMEKILIKERKFKMAESYKVVPGSNAEFLLQRNNFFDLIYYEENSGTNKHKAYIDKYEKEGKLTLEEFQDLLNTYRENVRVLRIEDAQIGQWNTLHKTLQFATHDTKELNLIPEAVKTNEMKKEGRDMSDPIPSVKSPKQEQLEREHAKKMAEHQKRQQTLREAEEKKLAKLEEEKNKDNEKFEKETRIAQLTDELTALKGTKKNPLQLASAPQATGFVVLLFAFLATLFQFFKPKVKKKRRRRPEYAQQQAPPAEAVREKVVEKVLEVEYA